jgi:hypothetical protein
MWPAALRDEANSLQRKMQNLTPIRAHGRWTVQTCLHNDFGRLTAFSLSDVGSPCCGEVRVQRTRSSGSMPQRTIPRSKSKGDGLCLKTLLKD